MMEGVPAFAFSGSSKRRSGHPSDGRSKGRIKDKEEEGGEVMRG